MKKGLKGFVVGVVVAVMLMSTTAFAAGLTQKIDVVLNSVNLAVNGKSVQADNILYKGTTYVPLRAVSEMLGKHVDWNGGTNTASINDEATEVEDTEKATKAEQEWQEVITFEGSSIKDTETFKISSGEWRINWSTKPGDMGDMNFQIYVYKANGDLESVAANIIGAGSDTSYMRGSGEYYFTINTSQPYTIVVEEKS